ncbi:MAG: LPS export ABC transporter periplasmic protein LptC [Acidobacteria bacterium]|nr:LPS export ABC transporter periplasmic protein LptC [Acidobacteriota bacterium]
MRRTRRIVLFSILLIIASVGFTYKIQKGIQERQAPPPTKALPERTSAQAHDWVWSKTIEGGRTVEVRAKDFRQISEPSRFELAGLELRIFRQDGKTFDRVTSAAAEFDTTGGILWSDGNVEIIMGVPAGEEPRPGRLLTIRSSGVRFDSKTGKAVTERAASFQFDRGEGKSIGAEYDPATRELQMRRDVELRWYASRPGGVPMDVRAGYLTYKEAEGKVYLSPWAKLARGTLTLESADAAVTLHEGLIQLVEAQKAHGVEDQPGRRIEYAADQLRMDFSEHGQVSAITGESNARLVSTSESARTTVTTQRIDLAFTPSEEESLLEKATAQGASRVESTPVPRPGKPPADTRILHSEVIQLRMRSGGREIENVETHTPGTLDILPSRRGEKRRSLRGERLWINYGSENRIESFRAVSAATRTEPAPVKGAGGPPVLTSSRDLSAAFSPTGELTRLEQWNDFRYEEGDRRARAQKAILDSASDLILLEGAARVWDATGSTTGDRITLHQKTSDFEAAGNVTSVRLPDRKKDADGTSMLAGDEPLRARAARMSSTGNRRRIRYQGSAELWQGANRLTAEWVEIDRAARRLHARTNVATQFAAQDEKKKQPAVITSVRASELVYTEEGRLAHFKGGALLNRPGLTVQGQEIRAFLKAGDSGSTLDHALADGQVRIVQAAPDRRRTGTGEHAEYHVAEERVMLEGGRPELVDSRKGITRGQKLTWFFQNDRLLVDGAKSQPASTQFKRK